jgi:hypothetical protein
MSTGSDTASRIRRDLLQTWAGVWLWCLPIGIFIGANMTWNGSHLPSPIMGILMTVATVWIGGACYVNRRRCSRVHCTIDGYALLLLSLAGLLNLLGLLSFNWNIYSSFSA